MSYEVHLLPPDYPAACRPWSCRHEPQFVMQHSVHVVPQTRGGNGLEIDHSVCLACGAPRPCTIGGNVLVDLHMLWERFGFHPAIGSRVLELRDRWSRLATYLFDENGWNGRHERVARMIDPNLTMRVEVSPAASPSDVRTGKIKFDPEFLRWDDEAEPNLFSEAAE